MIHRKLSFLLRVTAIALIPTALASAESWTAQPIVVHEWGVQSFDWSAQTPPQPADLPPFIYTDKNPGTPAPLAGKRVKDLPPDSGIRDKPILYFYPPTHSIGEPVVGVEMRFAQGHANAWWPQVTTYRTPEMTQNAPAFNPEKWDRNPHREGKGPVPDDKRMELVWSRLTLSAKLPPDTKLAGEDLPNDHWLKQARNTNSAYLTNGKETEKFLFYEGATHEQPALAIIPATFGITAQRPTGAVNIINVSDSPIYNVTAIYNDHGHTWIGYLSVLEPMPHSTAGQTIATLQLPDFKTLTEWTDEKSLPAATTDRLLANLTEGNAIATSGLRDPADPQGPTASHSLYPDEAKALEKIWHNQFFTAPGLTILYRQSPAQLDADMPLNIHTDMYHYIQLSRCGLILNSNIDLPLITRIQQAAQTLAYNNNSVEVATALALLKSHPLLAESAFRYDERIYSRPEQIQAARKKLLDAGN